MDDTLALAVFARFLAGGNLVFPSHVHTNKRLALHPLFPTSDVIEWDIGCTTPPPPSGFIHEVFENDFL